MALWLFQDISRHMAFDLLFWRDMPQAFVSSCIFGAVVGVRSLANSEWAEPPGSAPFALVFDTTLEGRVLAPSIRD